MPAMKTGLFKAAAERKPKRKSWRQWKRKRAKTEQSKIVLDGPRKGVFSRWDSCSLLPKWEDTRKETEKEIPMGEKDPKVPVRQASKTNWYASIFQRCNVKRNPHAIVGTHQNHTTHPKSGCTLGMRVSSNTRAKPVKTNMEMQLLP